MLPGSGDRHCGSVVRYGGSGQEGPRQEHRTLQLQHGPDEEDLEQL